MCINRYFHPVVVLLFVICYSAIIKSSKNMWNHERKRNAGRVYLIFYHVQNAMSTFIAAYLDTNMLVVTKYSVETINPLKYCLMEFLPFPFLRIKNKYEHFSRHGWTFNDHLFSYVLVCTSSHRKKLSASCQWNVAQVWLNHGMIKTTKNFSERKKKTCT